MNHVRLAVFVLALCAGVAGVFLLLGIGYACLAACVAAFVLEWRLS